MSTPLIPNPKSNPRSLTPLKKLVLVLTHILSTGPCTKPTTVCTGGCACQAKFIQAGFGITPFHPKPSFLIGKVNFLPFPPATNNECLCWNSPHKNRALNKIQSLGGSRVFFNTGVAAAAHGIVVTNQANNS